MGTQKSQVDLPCNFNLNDWIQIYCDTEMRVLSHRQNSNIQIEEHPLFISSSRDLNFAQQLFSIRKNDRYLINAIAYNLFTNVDSRDQRGEKGLIYTQRIPNRLTNIGLLKFPQYLHTLFQSINGFQTLCKNFGYFKVFPNCIGINSQKVVKVWHNPDFGSIIPYQNAYSQQQMIFTLIDSIEAHVDITSMSKNQQSFRVFLLKNCQNLNFPNVKIKLAQFAQYFNNGLIPNNLTLINTFIRPQNHRNQINEVNVRRTQQNYYLPKISAVQSYQPNIQRNFGHHEINYSQNKQLIQPLTKIPQQIINYQALQPITFFNSQITPNLRYQQNFSNNQHIQNINYQNNQVSYRNIILQSNSNPNININNEAKVPLLIRNRQQFIKPKNIEYNSMRSSQVTFSPQPYPRSRKNSIPSQSLQINKQPLNASFQIKQFPLNKADSQKVLSHGRFFNSISRDRSFSVKNSPLKPSFIHNSSNQGQGVLFNNQINKNQMQITQPHRQLKPSSIKQAIQKSQFKQAKIGNQQNRGNRIFVNNLSNHNINNHIHNQYVNHFVQSNKIIKPIILPQNNYSHSQIQSVPNASPHLQASIQSYIPLNNQNSNMVIPNKDPWETIMRVIKSKPNIILEQQTKQLIISPRPNINEEQLKQKFIQFPSKSEDGYQSEKDKNQTNNISFSSVNEAYGISVLARQSSDKLFEYYKDTESINNSSARNFYSSYPGQDFSQVIQPSSPLDYRLSGRQRYDLSKIGQQSLGMSSSKLFEQKADFTPLDLMQQLKITQTIIKNDQNQKQDFHYQLTTKQRSQRSRSKQFSQQVANLGFKMNSEQSSNNSADVSMEHNRKDIQRQLIQEWTPSYKQSLKNHNYNYGYEQKLKYDWQHRQFSTSIAADIPSSNSHSHSNQNQIFNYNYNQSSKFPSNSLSHENKSYKWKQNEYNFDHTFGKPKKTQYPNYDNLQLSPQKQYKFEWDPELLADIQSKEYSVPNNIQQ